MNRFLPQFGLATLFCLLLFGSTSAICGQEKAATGELPRALAGLSISPGQIVTTDEAHAIRGAGGLIPSGEPLAPGSVQIKQVCVSGVATGTVTIMEGMFAQFRYTDGHSIEVEGTFGGLEGWVGTVDGQLGFALQGKAYQESFEFAGQITQIFGQEYILGTR